MTRRMNMEQTLFRAQFKMAVHRSCDGNQRALNLRLLLCSTADIMVRDMGKTLTDADVTPSSQISLPQTPLPTRCIGLDILHRICQVYAAKMQLGTTAAAQHHGGDSLTILQ